MPDRIWEFKDTILEFLASKEFEVVSYQGRTRYKERVPTSEFFDHERQLLFVSDKNGQEYKLRLVIEENSTHESVRRDLENLLATL